MVVEISKLTHPEYDASSEDYEKWRLCYTGGRQFIRRYLEKFTARESNEDFQARMRVTHCPAYAKMGLNKLKNTFYSRMSEITRLNGPKSYQEAILGKGGGVDLNGSTMNGYLGQVILPELMSMGRVGIFVDRGPITSKKLSDNRKNAPYLYMYPVEAIQNWDMEKWNGEYVYTHLILQDQVMLYDEATGLPVGVQTLYREMWMKEGVMHVQMWRGPKENEEGSQKVSDEQVTTLKAIPFLVPSLQESMLVDVVDYQIGLLNVASSDMSFILRGNVATYTEQYDPATDNVWNRPMMLPEGMPTGSDPNAPKPPAQGTAGAVSRGDDRDEVRVGTFVGRRYPKNTDRPEFIAPPTGPIQASMARQEQMKLEIMELLDIAAAQATAMHQSAESKQMDNQGLESGLSNIGLELEWAENQIGKFWCMYENEDPDSITIKYPTKYTLKSDAQRLEEAKALNELKSSYPSKTAAKAVAFLGAKTLLDGKFPDETLRKIESEINAAEFTTSDPNTIKIASELGMVDAVTGSNALGFEGEKVVPQAQKEHAERLAAIAESQATGAARGVLDQGPIQGNGSESEKADSQKPKDTDTNPAPGKARGDK